MTLAQKKASFGHVSNLTTGFIGSFFTKFWHFGWKVIGAVITHIVGRESIFALNHDGTYKRDKNGKRLPALRTKVALMSLENRLQSRLQTIGIRW